MDPLVLAYCRICQDTFEHQDLLYLLCGHAFCETCTKRTSKDASCATCRSPKNPPGDVKPHRIFPLLLNASDGGHDQAEAVLHLLAQDKLPLQTKNLKKLAGNMESLDDSLRDRLTRAITLVEEKVGPLERELDVERQSNLLLQSEVQRLNRKLDQGKEHYRRLQKTSKGKEGDHADLIKDLQSQLSAERARSEKQAREAQRRIDELSEEVALLTAQCEKKDVELRLCKTKLKYLGRSAKKAKSHDHGNDEDDSLIVMD